MLDEKNPLYSQVHLWIKRHFICCKTKCRFKSKNDIEIPFSCQFLLLRYNLKAIFLKSASKI